MITADSTLWTADTHCVTADGRIVCIAVDVVEAAVALDAIDASAGANVVSGTVVEAADAIDDLNASVISRIVALAAYYRRPAPVVGRGYGVLPQLEGEAHGVVGVAGAGVAVLPIGGEAHGEADDWPDDVELMLLLALAA